jgi:hypothetical protein
MKNTFKVLSVRLFGIIAFVAVFTLSAANCSGQSGGGKIVNNAEELKAYIDSQPANKPDKPIKVAMNAKDIIFSKISNVIMTSGKYVSIDLSDSPITTIPYRAFFDKNTKKGCETLVSIIIPNSVTSIGDSAFYFCTSLTSITIPSSVTSIGDYAFEGCTRLTSITIPNSVTSIGYSAFSGCTRLTSITIPSSVTRIEDYAFEGCTRLTSITIPDSVTSIGNSAFLGCTSLTSIAIPDSVTSIGRNTFQRCTSLTSVTIPSSVTIIEDVAFYNCTSLTSVTFATGSNISDANFGTSVSPEGSTGEGGNTLKTAYNAASPKAGSYTRSANGSTWSKQP